MKNRFLTLMVLFASFLWVQGTFAQTANETYYLYNTSSGRFLSYGDTWGTRATADKLGTAFQFVSNGTGYSLRNIVTSAVKNSSQYFGSNLFVDNGTAQAWTFTASGDGYTISNGTSYLVISAVNSYNQYQINTTTTAADAAVWKLLTKTEYATFQDSLKNAQAAAVATSMGLTGITTYSGLESAVTSATDFKSSDKTSSISNYDFSSAITTGWTVSNFNTNRQGSRGIASGNYQTWNGTMNIGQTLTGLPAGVYKIQVQAFYRFGNANRGSAVYTAGESMVAYLYANDNYVPLKDWWEEADQSASTPNSQAQAATSFTGGKYWNEIYAYVGTAGTLSLGIYDAGYVDNNWLVMDNFKLTYYTNTITAAEVTALEATIPTGKMNADVETALGSAKSTLDGAQTIANYNALSTAIANANASIAVYTKVNAAITAAQNNAATLDAAGQAAFDISAVSTAYTNGTITDGTTELSTIQSTLVAAVKAQTTAGSSMTLALVNPDLTNGTTGWTTTFSTQTASYTNFTGMFLEKWVASPGPLSNVSCLQTISGMPSGVYELKAACLGTLQNVTDSKGSTKGVYLFINGDSTSVATANAAPEYFTVKASVTDGNITVGLATVGTTANWIAWDNVTLTFKGTANDALYLDVTNAKDSLATYSASIPSGVYATFASHITAAQNASSTDDTATLQAILDNLNADITTAAALTANYLKLKSLISACELNRDHSTPDDGLAVDGGGTLNTLATAITAATTSLDEATATSTTLGTAYSTLEAARQAYVTVATPVSGYPFDYTFKVTNPSFETGDLTGWTISNTTGDQAVHENSNAVYTITPADGNYVFNSWNGDAVSYTLAQTVTSLPIGTYSLSAYVASFEGKTVTLYAGDSINAYVTTGGKAISHTATIAQIPVNNGSLTIGVKAGVFYKVDNFVLNYTGFDNAKAVASLAAYIAEADSILLPANNIYIGSPQTTALSTANNAAKAITTSSTRGQIVTATTNIIAAINDAYTSQTSYAALKALIDKITAIMPTFSGLSDAQDVYDNQSDTPATVDAATETLRTGFTSYPTNNDTYTAPMNMTSYYLVNGDFSDGTNGWTKTGSFTASNTWTVASNVLTFAPASGHYTGCTTWQKVTLAAGSYKLSADVNAGALAGKTACLFAATKDPAWNNVLSDVLASRDVTTYGSYESLSVIFTLTAETEVRLGVNAYAYNTSTGAYASYSVKNFKLEQAKNETVTVNGTTTATGTWTAAEIAAIPVTTNIKALDLKAVTIPANTTVTVTSNPNCLIYAADASNLTNSSNVVAAGACAKLVVADGYPFVPTTSFTTSDATYNRSVYTDGGWETFCSPIATEAQEGYTYEEFTSYASNQATFTAISGTTLAANTPYIMKKTTGSGTAGSTTALTLTNTTAQTISAPAASTLEFRGTLVPYTVSAAEVGKVYKMKADGSGFNQAKENGVIPAFRGYLYLTSGGSGIVIRHEGLTAIDGITVDGNAPADVYTLDGRLLRKNVKAAQAVQGLEKGIYVVNGKKIVVK